MRKSFAFLSPAAVLALGTLAAISSQASTITYATSGVFNCNGLAGCTASGNVATVGGLTVTYESQASTNVVPNPTVSANYGDIFVTGAATTAMYRSWLDSGARQAPQAA